MCEDENVNFCSIEVNTFLLSPRLQKKKYIYIYIYNYIHIFFDGGISAKSSLSSSSVRTNFAHRPPFITYMIY